MSTKGAGGAAGSRGSPCPGCGLVLDPVEGPTHAYIGASPACWAVYGVVLEREYSDPVAMGIHRLTVDAYAAQHPGAPSRRSIQSVACHLAALHWTLEREHPGDKVTRLLRRLVEAGPYEWLEPPGPEKLGAITVAHVAAAESIPDHIRRVEEWARAVWAAWGDHHDTVRRWGSRITGG